MSQADMTPCKAVIKATVFIAAIFGGIQLASGSRVSTCVAGSDEIVRQTRRPLGNQGAGGFFWNFPLVEEFTELLSGFGRSEISLPQDPKANVEDRKEQLAERQQRYRWSTEGLPTGIPFLEGFPPQEELPSLSWFMKLGTNMASSIVGATRGQVGIGEIVSEMVEALTSREKALAFGGKMRDLIRNDRVNERPAGIEDYADLHASPIKIPDSVHDYEQDDAFARQRLQGGNCAVIEKCSSATRQKLKVLDSDPSYEDLRQRVDSLMASGKLFVVDHELLKGMEASPLDGEIPRYLAPGIALFEVVDDDLLPIKPIGIQLSQGEEATPIFTPEDGYNWMIAKAHFESADFIIHEVVSHLGNTHLLLEGPLVALHRQLPEQHPIYALMNPHLEGTALINWGAQEMLIVEGGGVDRLQGNKIEDTWRLVLETTLERMSNDFSPEADFEARRVTKEDFPGRYPYRDFGLRFWDATHTWVKEYLDIYYTSESDITADYELEAFIDELIKIGQVGWLKDFHTSRDKKSFLAKAIASYIYTASTLHAAVNFPQRSLMSFTPNTPGAMYAPPPLDKTTRTFEDYLDCLPPMEMAKSQAVLGNLLGSVFHTRLGDYERGHFLDKRVQGPLTNFQRTLDAIEADIVDENDYVVEAWSNRGKGTREAANFAYNTLLPDCIPQSINI